jgi:polyphosphate kinase
MMHRNLDRRVETLVRLRQADHIAEMQRLFELAMNPQASAWNLGSDGVWIRNGSVNYATGIFDVQDQIMARTLAMKPGVM